MGNFSRPFMHRIRSYLLHMWPDHISKQAKICHFVKMEWGKNRAVIRFLSREGETTTKFRVCSKYMPSLSHVMRQLYLGYKGEGRTLNIMIVEWKIETVVAFRFIRPTSNTYQEQQPYAHDMVKLWSKTKQNTIKQNEDWPWRHCGCGVEPETTWRQRHTYVQCRLLSTFKAWRRQTHYSTDRDRICLAQLA